MLIRFPNKWRAGETDDRLISFIDFKPTILSLAGVRPPEYVDGRAFLGEYATTPERQYIHGAADRFDEEYDMIRAVRNHRFKYLKNFRTEQGYYLPVSYREQMPVMQELLRMRDAGELDEYQAQWFRPRKVEEELFDTENDPFELHNLAADPQYADRLAELRAECERWMAAIDDKGLMPEPDFIASLWPDDRQPQTMAPTASTQNSRVTLTCGTDGASIGYQVLAIGDSLANTWQVYTEKPIALDPGERVIAVAHRLGYLPSIPVTFGQQ
jgi:hypothetical protein